MKRLLFSILTILFVRGLSAQEGEQKFGAKLSGYVKNDFFYDTRQTVSAREGHFLLWPSPVMEDLNGKDVNAGANFNMLAIESRLSFAITGPDALGARTSGLIEGDFFAQVNDNINLLRLRHAYVKLNWTHAEVLVGQYWNPLFVTDCFPTTVSFNVGTPLQSFSRNPQVRVTYTVAGVRITAAALSQRDYSSVGMENIGSQYLRNSAVPDMHLQAQYGFKGESGFGLIVGAGMAYKTLVPRLSSTNVNGTFKLDEKVGGITLMAYAKITSKPVTTKIQFRYGENITDVLAISGFAVREVIDLESGESLYTPLRGMTWWGEIHTNGNPQVGIFGGITLNMGTKKEMTSTTNPVYGLAPNIRSLYRVSPRVLYNIGKVRLALELEYTSAAYGSGFNTYYIPSETVRANNLRALMAVYYFF
jgi:hypothetical protein